MSYYTPENIILHISCFKYTIFDLDIHQFLLIIFILFNTYTISINTFVVGIIYNETELETQQAKI